MVLQAILNYFYYLSLFLNYFYFNRSLSMNEIYHFSAGEVITFRFDSFLPEENYTTNATIQCHPENNEVVYDIKKHIEILRNSCFTHKRIEEHCKYFMWCC